jgi:hypothetical protein
VIKSWIFAIIAVITFASITPARASLTDCQGLYVGRIWVEQGYGLRAVVLLESETASSGSYWTYFDNWSAEEKKAVLAILTGAKLSGHRVNVETAGSVSCAITTGGSQMKSVYLANSP